MVAAISACAFAEAARIERIAIPGERRPVAVLAPRRDLRRDPVRLFGAGPPYLVVLWLYAAASFFIVQHARHLGQRIDAKLTQIRLMPAE